MIAQWQWKRYVPPQDNIDEPADFPESDPDLSIVYIVRERRWLARLSIFRVSLNRRVLGGIGSGDYYVAAIPPGEHLITVEFMSHGLTMLERSLDLSTTAGSTHFVKIHLSFSGEPRPKIIDSTEGQQIASRGTMLVAADDVTDAS
jgi:hypothetical protein